MPNMGFSIRKLPPRHTQEKAFPEIQLVFMEKKVRPDAWLYKDLLALSSSHH